MKIMYELTLHTPDPWWYVWFYQEWKCSCTERLIHCRWW